MTAPFPYRLGKPKQRFSLGEFYAQAPELVRRFAGKIAFDYGSRPLAQSSPSTGE